MQKLPTHWIMYRLGAMGDVALTTGVLNFWHKEHGLRFTVVTREANAQLFKNHPAVDDVVGLTREALHVRKMLGVWVALMDQHKNAGLLDLHGTMRSYMLADLWQGTVRHYPKLSVQRRAFLLSGGRLCANALLRWNVPQRYALALKELLPANQPPERERLIPHIVLDDNETMRAQELLLMAGLPADSRPVALHPYATHVNKAWPKNLWERLYQQLDAEGIPWVILGQTAPEHRLNANRLTTPNFSGDLTNKTSLRETCALLSLCRCLVTGDSGPMHLAAGVGTPVVGMFGPTTAHWGFFPAAAQDTVLEVPGPCRPCSLHGSTPCKLGLRCLTDISVDRVLEAVLSVAFRKYDYAKKTQH